MVAFCACGGISVDPTSPMESSTLSLIWIRRRTTLTSILGLGKLVVTVALKAELTNTTGAETRIGRKGGWSGGQS